MERRMSMAGMMAAVVMGAIGLGGGPNVLHNYDKGPAPKVDPDWRRSRKKRGKGGGQAPELQRPRLLKGAPGTRQGRRRMARAAQRVRDYERRLEAREHARAVAAREREALFHPGWTERAA